MSTSLLNRLDRLESQLLPQDDAERFIFVSFVSAPKGEKEPTRGEFEGAEFFRRVDESVGEFMQRITESAGPRREGQSGRLAFLHE